MTFKENIKSVKIAWAVFWKVVLSCVYDIVVYEIWHYKLARILKPNKDTIQIFVKYGGKSHRITASRYEGLDPRDVAHTVYKRILDVDFNKCKKL